MTLDTATLIGDFVMLVLWLPVQMVLDWWYPQTDAPPQGGGVEASSTNGAAKPTLTRVPSDSRSNLPTRVTSGSGLAAAQSKASENAIGTRTRRTGANMNSVTQTSRKSSAAGPSTSHSNHAAPAVASSMNNRISSGSQKVCENTRLLGLRELNRSRDPRRNTKYGSLHNGKLVDRKMQQMNLRQGAVMSLIQ